jgi:histone acetyltransferase (RNA polymerase elongator complex component)
VEIGAQSMDDHVLDRAKRGHTVADTARALRLLRAHGLEIGLQLMVGLPGETTKSFLDGVDAVAALAPDFVRLYPALVLENTELAKLYRNSPWRPLSLARAVVLTGRARERFLRQGIDVIRMGLQDSAELAKQVLGGPYHPAFGELVMTRSWYLRIGRLLKRAGPGKTLKLAVSERDYSALAGLNKTNLKRLKNLSRGAALEVQTERFLKRNTFYYAVH